MASSDLLAGVLRDVSRSFYLTLRALPGRIRPQIGLAYLLARMTDTIADTSLVPLDRRLNALRQLRARILSQSAHRLDFSEFTRLEVGAEQPIAGAGLMPQAEAASAAERRLLTRVEEALDSLERLPRFDREQLRTVLATITSGQELDLVRFAESSPTRIVALATDEELDDYTYRVAGCVGEFWTRMCRAYVFPEAVLDDEFLLSAGVRFGKGLQLVNVLRDLPRDLRRGRCYLPSERLRAAGLSPADVAECLSRQSGAKGEPARSTPPPAAIGLGPSREPAAAEERLEALIEGYAQVALAHLAAGWGYTLALPWRAVRVRLACAWPILIGIRTLQKQREERNPLSFVPAKVSRSEVHRILICTTLLYPWPRLWGRLFGVLASGRSW